MSYRIYLKKKEDKRIRAGHPWVYANEVERIEGEGGNGDVAAVYDHTGIFLGKGYINHLSKILVRLFMDKNEEDGPELIKTRIENAFAYRKRLGYENCCRVVFSESDRLPGLVVDKYADVFCIQVLTLGMDRRKDWIISALAELFSPKGIYERSDAEVRKKEGLKPFKGPVYGDFDPRVVITENGLSMTADLENGQKTGYFLDQKENRLALRRYVKDADVLDCFCNVGGFSVNAAAGGASSVTAVDVSERALADVRENAALNGFADIIHTEKGDVFEVLRAYRKEGRTFDVVVLDPPAFCKSAAEVPKAYAGYKDINILGMKLVNPGGFLATASCSHYMTQPLFEKMLKEAARDAGKTCRVAEIRTQAPDHAALLASDETTYLKFYVLQVL
ncbi:MAG: class I SAM-dependent rRNA methyltransferase [Eubacterium sp.]|nr:class I SAM-dependent rRNA methyltransferase [Eubacterium sp.]